MDNGLEILERAKAKLTQAAEYRRLAVEQHDQELVALYASLAAGAIEDYRWLSEMAVRLLVPDPFGG